MDLSQLVEALRSQLSGVEGADLSTLNQLSQALEPYNGLDPQAARQALTDLQSRQQQDANFSAVQSERDDLRSQLQASQTFSTNLQRELGAVRSMTSAGVRPEYEDLLLPKVAGALELQEDGVSTLPDGYIDGLKQQYPAAFFAADAGGTGGAGQGGQAPDESSAVSVGVGGTVTGVDPQAVLNGSVTIK